jgi:glycosyltransferase 2 family protein
VRAPAIEWAIVSVVVAIVVVVAVSVFVVGFDTLAGRFRDFDLVMVSVVCVLTAWQLTCRFLRWFLFTRFLGLRIPPLEATLFYAAAFGMTLTPGRLGEALRLWFLEKRFGVPYRRTAGLYIADRVSDATSYLVLFALGSVVYEPESSIGWSGLVLTVAIIVTIMRPKPILKLVSAIYVVLRKGKKLLVSLRRTVRNTSTLFQPRVFLPGLVIGIVGWFAAPTVLTLSLAQMGIHINLLHATAIYATAALAGGSTMMPGGGGATEAVLVALLAGGGVPLDAAVPAMLVTRVAFLWLPVGLGILLLPLAMKVVRVARKPM